MSEELSLTGPENLPEAVKSADLALSDKTVIPASFDHHPVLGHVFGPELLRVFFVQMRKAFSDLDIAVEALVSDSDAVAFAYTLIGTQDGTLMGIPPTGDRVKIHAVFEIKKGQNAGTLKQFRQTRRTSGTFNPALA